MEVINPWVEKGRREGLQKGELIGLQKGKQEGLAHEQKVILKQLQKRFGSVPTEVEEGVKKLDLDGLESFAEAIFDFSSIDDLIVWLKK